MGLDFYLFTGLGVSALSGFAAGFLKRSESDQGHFTVFFLKRFGDTGDEEFQASLCIGFADFGILGLKISFNNSNR
jgi:hypothetical protein